jgi:hypothetical protein
MTKEAFPVSVKGCIFIKWFCNNWCPCRAEGIGPSQLGNSVPGGINVKMLMRHKNCNKTLQKL